MFGQKLIASIIPLILVLIPQGPEQLNRHRISVSGTCEVQTDSDETRTIQHEAGIVSDEAGTVSDEGPTGSNFLTVSGDTDMEKFQELGKLDWKPVFKDTGDDDWKQNWFLDGEKARIGNSPEGMEFFAGPLPADDSSHSVLWTKRSFGGNLRIDYEYTRLDSATRYVNILFLLATGSGAEGYPADIRKWSAKRKVPAMRTYFNHMNLLHISYSAFDNANTENDNDYIRARRYIPETGKGLEGTGLVPDYFRTGFFEPGEPHRIRVIKYEKDLYMYIKNREKEMLCHWDLSGFPPLDEGRIGIRHMGSRAARYGDFRVFEPNPVRPIP